MIKSNELKQIDLGKILLNIDHTETPFTSLLLRKGIEKASSTIVSWEYEGIDETDGLVKEGTDVSDFQKSVAKGGNKNAMQILRKAVNISDTAQAVSTEHIADLFAHELNNRTIEIKRDLEKYLVNGVLNEIETTTKPRQMAGVLKFIETSNKLTTSEVGSLGVKDLVEATKVMKKAGTASQNLLLLVDYNMLDRINTLYEDKTSYIGIQNEFGDVVRKINTQYASVTPYLVDSLPQDTCLIVNLDYLKIAELRPLKYVELAKTGSSRKGFIEMENTLKVKNPNAITQISLRTV